MTDRICKNCKHWEQIKEMDDGVCAVVDCIMRETDTCELFSVDPARFCAVCSAPAVNVDSCSGMECSANENHFASQWDNEWMDLTDE